MAVGPFEFSTASQIIFRRGAAHEIAKIVAGMGTTALLVTGKNPQRAAFLEEDLRHAQLRPVLFHVEGEPTVECVVEGVKAARDAGCDLVIAYGGGSAIDAAKAVAALLRNNADILEYLEVIGRGRPLERKGVPVIAIPTTAGTGSEVTKNSVLTCTERRVKVSMRSPFMLPDLAVVDPEATSSMPPATTAATGLDALTQIIEAFVSIAANPLTDAICREGLRTAARSLRRVYEDGSDAQAREDMCLASLCGGLALANARLGAVHGFAAPVGGMFSAPHGMVCARLLPFVVEVNIGALERSGRLNVLERFDEIARILTQDTCASARDGVTWISNLCEDMQTVPLTQFGVKPEHFPAIIEGAKMASSMKGNPISLSDKELERILAQAL